jgi:hypothetical protein
VLIELVKANTEQDRFILEIIVNKLGDPDYQVASRIIYHLNNYRKLFGTFLFKE